MPVPPRVAKRTHRDETRGGQHPDEDAAVEGLPQRRQEAPGAARVLAAEARRGAPSLAPAAAGPAALDQVPQPASNPIESIDNHGIN